MTKLWTYFKKVVLVWGFISLAFFLLAVISLTISTFAGKKIAQVEQEEGFHKDFNDIKLKVTRNYDETSSYFVNISKGSSSLITDYRIPTEKYDLDWFEVTDASIVPVKENEYRVILYSAIYDCDQESGHFVWLFKLNNQMQLVKMISLSDVHKVEGDDLMLFGNKIISLPSFTDFKYEQIVMPLEVGIGEAVRIAPMMNQRSIDIMRHYYGSELDRRIDKLTASSDGEMLKQYQKASAEFKEVLSEKTYPF